MQKSFICLFASIWTHIIGPIFPSNFSSGISDFSLKIEYLKNPFFITFLIEKWPIWARSSAGRAFGSHPKGSGVRSSSGPPKMEIAVVKTTAISHLTTEIPQTDFCFDHRKGIPCLMGMPFLLVYCPSVFEPWEPVLDRVFDTAV